MSDPFSDDGIEAGAIEGHEPGYVVISQRCDLIRCLHDEPFVELAHATFETGTNVINSARKNSSRLLHIADGADGAWIADLRHRALLAKDQILANAPLNPVPPGTARRRLKLRIGQRYSRDALPADLVERLQRPVTQTLRKAAPRRNSELFNEWLVFRDGERVTVQALFDLTKTTQQAADDAYSEIEKALDESVRSLIDETNSGAIALQQINLWRYFEGFKMDLDEITYGSKASPHAAKPTM